MEALTEAQVIISISDLVEWRWKHGYAATVEAAFGLLVGKPKRRNVDEFNVSMLVETISPLLEHFSGETQYNMLVTILEAMELPERHPRLIRRWDRRWRNQDGTFGAVMSLREADALRAAS